MKTIKYRQHAQIDLEHYYKRLMDQFAYEKDNQTLTKAELDQLHLIIVQLGEFLLTVQHRTNQLLAEQEVAHMLEPLKLKP